VGTETNQALESTTKQVNSLTSQLALVNQNMNGSSTEDGQSPEILDRRDLILRQLSELARIKTTFNPNGSVNVALGNTATQGVVVNGMKSRPIGIDTSVPGKMELLLDPYGNPESLASASGGQLGGLQTFISQVLEPAQKSLNFLAKTLVNETNQIQRNGIDGFGQTGQDLFALDPTVSNEAAGIKVSLTDAMRVATAAQFRVTENQTNSSNTRATVSFTPSPVPLAISNTSLVNNSNPTAGVTIKVDGARVAAPVTTLAAGVKATFFIDDAKPGQQLQVMTRDGRQLLGAAVDPTSLMGAALMSTNGVAAGATYSADYLNKSGDAGYKKMTVFYGARAAVLQQPNYDNLGQVLSRTPLPASLSGGVIDTQSQGFAAGAFVLNGVSLDELPAPTGSNKLSANDMAAWINRANGPDALPKPSGVTATAINEIRVPDRQLNLSASLSINSIDIGSGPFDGKQALVNAINSKAGVGVVASLASDGSLILRSVGEDGKPDGSNIDIQAKAGGSNAPGNALGLTAGLFGGTLRLTRPLSAAPVQAPNSNQIKIPASQLNLALPLAINGQTVGQPGVAFASVQKLADAINQAQSVVVADVGVDGSLTLTSLNGPDNNSIQIASNSAGDNSLGNALGLPAQVFRSAITAGTTQTTVLDTPIELGFGTGTPADLAQLGLRTGVFIEGAAKEDLLVFVTGAGTASVAASYSGKPVDAQQSLRAQPLELNFTTATHYRIRDVNTDTIVAERDFDPSQLSPGVTYQGLQLTFSTPPAAGDVYKVDGNADGTGNNENMLAIAAMENKNLVGNKTLGTAYIDHVNNVGNTARQATIAQAALKVIHEQAVIAKDQVSGVSLDQEAADLIRFQQAYQAAAKVLQVGSQLFDSILQVR
jgi:flagellar hook-associated protein FlgK